MANFNLDVAFSSDVTPDDPNLPVAMAYGFTREDHGTYKGKGQGHQNATPGSQVSFAIYDTSQSSAFNVTSVQISAANKDTGGAQSPFNPAWPNGSITAVSSPNPSNPGQTKLNGPNLPNSSPAPASTGINIKSVTGSTCRSWTVGPFTIASLAGPQTFRIIITVLTQNGQQSKTFKVDPEVIVEGGNPEPKKPKSTKSKG
ncbi:MAG TPA: hypothetical protein VNZ44_03220 [Pyrinomonadaceae bacterium]|nr:hypothetical protein [Pyrinomonadaceae bacterium]